MRDIYVYASGKVIAGDKEYKCALGKNGVTANKEEGDWATPLGSFPIRRLFYRPDRLAEPKTDLVTVAIEPNYAWSDDPLMPEYNTLVRLPYGGSHEKLWREDEVYDLVVELGYNDDPPIPGRGSAIFMHIARPGYTPTAGCIALAKEDLLELLMSVEKNGVVHVNEA